MLRRARLRPGCSRVLLAGALLAVPRRASARSTVVIGHSVRGQTDRRAGARARRRPRRILLVGCIHGNECAGRAILSALRARPSRRASSCGWCGELNPDGTAAGTRQNAHGVDLNRNFPYRWRPVADPIYYSGPRPLSEPETAPR